MTFSHDLVVVGGCGHVGLPLSIAFADSGRRVIVYDTDPVAVATVRAGKMPFDEPGAPPVLERVLAAGRLDVSSDPAVLGQAEHVVVVIGTPVDEHLNPDPEAVPRAIGALSEYLVDGQILVLRSTVYPGVTRLVEKLVRTLGRDIDVAFCPERIAEGRALIELFSLPQVVSGCTPRAVARASDLSARSPTASSRSSPKRPNSPSSSRTPGVTSSSRPPISCT